MAAAELKLKIDQSIQAFSKGSLTANALHLFQTLGYNTERQAPLDKPTYTEFKENYIQPSSPFNETKALVGEWKYVDLLFQLSKEEVLKQTSLFTTKQVDRTAIEAYLFFTIELSGDHYSRTDLAHITREVNRLFAMPAMILFKYGTLLTLSVINRRLHKRDECRDVLEKVTLIKDIQIQNPHRAHIEILFDLSFDELKDKYSFTNFVELHTAWQKTLDTKELNKRFYRELANWYFWAVQNVEFPADTETERDLRNATNVIRLITRLIFVWFLKEKGLIPDELFSRNRLQQILNYTDDNHSTYYKAILQNLFFATLNTEMGKRQFRNRAKNTGDRDQHYMIHNVFRYEDYFAAPEETLKKYFSNIPFLNGGLFECLDRVIEVSPPLTKGGKGGFSDKKIVRIDSFSDRKDNVLKVPDELFFSEEQAIDLNNIYGTKNKTYRARGIINLLNSYKFTIDENTPVEEEVALDPELLGKVFENLLASYNPETGSTARKQTGSFYTPREIVNYMVDESLIAYLQTKLISPYETSMSVVLTKDDENSPPLFKGGRGGVISGGTIPSPHVGDSSKTIPSPLTGEGQGGGDQRLRHLFSYTDEPHQFNPNEVDILIDAIDSAKILDPACGSGAFPMGILHKLVYILSKLDPNNQKWRQRQINKVMEVPDVTVREKLIEDIEQAFQSNELDYGRKLYLIENAIFGVDIQPIAVQIAKLRFFISLIVDQKPLSTHPPFEKGGSGGILNLGIRPLPNLETKFVAANTLIGIERPQQLMLRNPDIDKKEAELKKIRERHFTARTPQTKEKYRKEDERLRTEISELLRKDGFTREVTEKLGKWNPYDQNASADFFDPEWMFGIKEGFDIGIGNPPWVSLIGKHGLEENKKNTKKLIALYGGNTSMPNLYEYFILRVINLLKYQGHLSFVIPDRLGSNISMTYLRKKIIHTTIINEIIYRWKFESIIADTMTLILTKQKTNDDYFIKVRYRPELQQLFVSKREVLDSEDIVFKSYQSSEIQSLVRKIKHTGKSLESFCNSTSGFGGKSDLITEHMVSKKQIPVLKGSSIGKYLNKYTLYFEFKDQNLTGRTRDESKLSVRNKILVRKTGNSLIASYDNTGIYPEQSLYFLYNFKKSINPKPLLAIINSSLMSWYYMNELVTNIDSTPQLKNYALDSLPVAYPDNDDILFISLVDYVLFVKSSNSINEISPFFERLIDAMVYELYLEKEVKAAGCEVLKHLTDLPELKEGWSDEEKLQTIEKVYNELSNPNHPVSVNMFKMAAIEEIRIIERKQ